MFLYTALYSYTFLDHYIWYDLCIFCAYVVISFFVFLPHTRME